MRAGARLLVAGLSISAAGALAACGGSTATPLPSLPPDTPSPSLPAVVETLAPATEAPAASEVPAATAKPTTGKTKYRVKKGDTLIAIAEKYGVTLKALMAANPNVQPRALKVGQIIIIPAK